MNDAKFNLRSWASNCSALQDVATQESTASGGHFMKYWGGGASARGLVRFISPCHGRGSGGMLQRENFKI